MNKRDTPTQQAAFESWIRAAQEGDATALNHFFEQLYERGKASLLSLTKSEAQAEEYFQAAVAKFWLNCVEGEKTLPKSNIEGYIYSIAKFYCIDQLRKQQRTKIQSTDTSMFANQAAFSEYPPFSIDQLEAAELQQKRRTIMHQMIQQLSANCQRLFKAILEDGIEKPKELRVHLGLSEVRRVSVLKHECYKRLRVLTAAALEKELTKRN
ncbi:MAG: sigma-70 family RNA polymerase sigma factor [Bacteroidota bacterium]